MASNRRLNIEIQNMMKDNNLERNHYCIELDGKTNSHLFGKIVGPPDTPFQRGVFTIDITIPDRYPLAPPACKFVTRVWHPNISSMTGAIGLDILHTQWSSAMTLESHDASYVRHDGSGLGLPGFLHGRLAVMHKSALEMWACRSIT
ncbi:unnamed protein product [Medioppia subpectinata]|uniref:UBC core domain-containing protein n=1 Tax=Medioppia subpectinata TaxID=1979941 RepID=A0A7R9KUH0_9ACAR|nr:unnamed protein product [Medioppia subpectinata]CAG2109955.1 unnamed protein product [Medioppia subpectinata]